MWAYEKRDLCVVEWKINALPWKCKVSTHEGSYEIQINVIAKKKKPVVEHATPIHILVGEFCNCSVLPPVWAHSIHRCAVRDRQLPTIFAHPPEPLKRFMCAQLLITNIWRCQMCKILISKKRFRWLLQSLQFSLGEICVSFSWEPQLHAFNRHHFVGLNVLFISNACSALYPSHLQQKKGVSSWNLQQEGRLQRISTI